MKTQYLKEANTRTGAQFIRIAYFSEGPVATFVCAYRPGTGWINQRPTTDKEINSMVLALEKSTRKAFEEAMKDTFNFLKQ